MLSVFISACLDFLEDDLIYLEFEFGECDIKPYNSSELGVKNVTWLDNSTLQIDASVSINCNFKIEGEDYEIDDKI